MEKKLALGVIGYLLAFVMICSAPVHAVVADFDYFYPSYDELINFINTIDSPIVTTRRIGGSGEEPPSDIKAIRISDNPDIDEDEPSFLFIGVIHGDEPLGVRVILQLLETLTENYDTNDEVSDWVNAYEIWIVPVLNPYGYDNNQRKNGPDTGEPATSGVDLNRNFEFRWDEGPVEPPDDRTYKGPYAASEPETKAIRDFVLEQRPVFGITFHSGHINAEDDGLIMWPWDSTDYPVSPPPDKDRLLAVAQVISETVAAEGRTAAAPIGQSNVYNYAATGMFDFMLETSTDMWNDNFFFDEKIEDYEDVEPKKTRLEGAQGYVSDYHDGLVGLLRYFLFDTTDGFTFTGPGITGLVHDCLTGEALPATVQVLELDDLDGDGDVDVDDLDIDSPADGSDLAFRTADTRFGRYMRLLEPGMYNVEFSLDGYSPVKTSVSVVDSPDGVRLVELNIDLDADRDGDGLTDCEEEAIGTDPFDSDSDDDGLTDGDEVNVHGTDPLDSDSDDDGLPDGGEVNVYGTDPLDSDSDDDGLLDGHDVEFIQNVVNMLPDDVFKGNGRKDHRTAINSILDDVEQYLLNGEMQEAIRILQNVRRHLDGGRNDWIVDSVARDQIRDLIELLINNLSSV